MDNLNFSANFNNSEFNTCCVCSVVRCCLITAVCHSPIARMPPQQMLGSNTRGKEMELAVVRPGNIIISTRFLRGFVLEHPAILILSVERAGGEKKGNGACVRISKVLAPRRRPSNKYETECQIKM